MSDWQPLPALPDLRRAGIIALDVETRDDGLLADYGSAWPWGDGHICGVSVAYRDDGAVRAHYFPIRHPDSQNFDPVNVFQWVRDHAAAGVHFVTQNGLYDWGWLCADAGIAMPPSEQLEETQALATIVDENRYHYGLEALCAWRGLPGKDDALLHAGCTALGLIPKGRKKFNPQPHIWQLPARYVGRYAEQDSASTLLLFESLDPVLDREGTRAAYRLEVDLLPMVHAMRRRGIRIDISAAEQARDLLLRKRDAVLAQISEKLGANIGVTEINGRKWLTSTFDRLGIKYPRTEKGNPSFKRGKRGWMQHSPHWLPPLIAAADQLDQYGDNFLQQQILSHIKNGRVYGEIHPHRSDAGGTRSLRFSYSHPPLQQMPKHDEELAPLIRSAFLPEEGEVWASCDYSQQEFRLVVHFAARKNMLGAAAARDRYIGDPATDIHAYTSELTGGKISRQDGKTANFMTIYGAGPEAIALLLNKPLSETKALLALYNEKMPFIAQLATACKNAAHRTGFFTLFNGARRHFNLWSPGGRWEEGAGPCAIEEAQRRVCNPGHPWYGRRLWRAETWKALNALIQSESAIQTKLWMRECWREGVVPLLQMHDSLDLSVSSPEVPEMVARLGENIIKLEVPMVVDVRYGCTWADAKHTWAELHAETSPRVESVVELHDDRPPAQPESPKFSNDSDEASDSIPWEGDENFTVPPAHEVDWSSRLEQDFPRVGETATTAAESSPPPPRDDDEVIHARVAEEDISQGPPPPPPSPTSPPPSGSSSGNGRGDSFDGFTDEIDRDADPNKFNAGLSGNGARRTSGSKTEAEEDAYTEEHVDEPFDDDFLRRQGYQLARVFDYTLADGALLYQQNRYELDKRVPPTKKRPRKRFLAHRKVNGKDILGAGDRRVPYNWPAIMRAAPGSTVFVVEGEKKAEALITAGLLATTVLSHKWAPECVAALTGHHLIILADHDDDGKKLAAAAQRKLVSVATSVRIVPATHLWKHLPGGVEPKPADDVFDWIKLGGDPSKLIEICREIPVVGTIVLDSVCAADEEIEDYDWVWPGRFALKKIGLITGLPDEGKGVLLSDIIARGTCGGAWPCGEGMAPIGNAILLTAEDDINDTVIPRLMAAGADLKRVHIIKMAHEAGKERMFSLVTDLPVLRQKAIAIGDVKMIIVDPLAAYLGIGKVDSFRATDVRAMIGPLKEFAEELRLFVLGVMHFNKKMDVTNLLLRVSDSLAYTAAARHVYGIVNDEDNERKLFVKGKNNLAPREQKTLAFGFSVREVGTDKRTGSPIRAPHIVWHTEPVDITATEALQALVGSKSPSARDNAKNFIEALLESGPVGAKDVQEAAKENGISQRTLRRAAEELKIIIKKDGPKNDKGEATWQWRLPTEKED
jgi:DNA polymerase I-like protein with 3'-5' exonuclease and polymerase domains